MIYKKIIFLFLTVCLYSENINLNDAVHITEIGNKFFYSNDFRKAELLYETALKIDNNYSPALNNLGMIYYYGGKNIDKNLTKAVKFLGRAAIRGHSNSQFYLAMSLAQIDSKIFNNEIVFWLEESAKNNFEKSQLLLGVAYIKGENIDKNLTKAKYWIQKSKDQNSSTANEIWKKYELWKY